MIIALDSASPIPPYEQVRAHLEAAIASRHIAPEERLPTVRQLAADLGLAANTVARAYRELEVAGLVETRGRHGTFVAGSPSEARRTAEGVTRDFVGALIQLGLGSQEIVAIVRRQLEADPGTAGPPGIT